MVGIDRLLFKTPDGPEFEFDGQASSVTQLSEDCRKTYYRAKDIFEKHLLMGLTEEELGATVDLDGIVDKLNEELPGYGFLKDPKLRKGMHTIKAFMDNPKTQGHFQLRTGNQVRFKPVTCLQLLRHCEEFKEHIYALIHVLPGMPKRLSEERRYKIFNIRERMRNIFRILKRLAIVGNYSKTTALSEYDRATLQFIPECVTRLIIGFFTWVADVENIFVKLFCPKRTANYECYLFSSFGRRWKRDRFSTILQRRTGWKLSQLRHILPGIVAHYHLEVFLPRQQDSVGDTQMGHSWDIQKRLYSRTKGCHPHLTNGDVHNTLNFCGKWEGLLGFALDEPISMSGDQMLAFAKGLAYQRESNLANATRELATIVLDAIQGPEDSNTNIRERLKSIQAILEEDRNSMPIPEIAHLSPDLDITNTPFNSSMSNSSILPMSTLEDIRPFAQEHESSDVLHLHRRNSPDLYFDPNAADVDVSVADAPNQLLSPLQGSFDANDRVESIPASHYLGIETGDVLMNNSTVSSAASTDIQDLSAIFGTSQANKFPRLPQGIISSV